MATSILLLDADPAFQLQVTPSLQQGGFVVHSAVSSVEAELLMKHINLDLIALAAKLSDGDGLKWLTKERESGLTTPVVFIHSNWRDAQEYHRLMDDLAVSLVVHKPVVPEVFVEEITAVLKPNINNTTLEIDDDPEFLSAISKIRQKYLDELPQELGTLSQMISKAAASSGSRDLVEEIRFRAHTLRGSAASLGDQELSKTMGLIEETIRACQAGGDSVDQRIWDVLKDLLDIWSQSTQKRTLDPDLQAVGAAREPPARSAATRSAMASTELVSILLVDDDKFVRDVVFEFGRQRLINVICAAGSEEALAKARETKVDAALLDVSLGASESSFGLAHCLRKIDGYEMLPLAFLSSSNQVLDQVAAAHAGASLFLSKPLTIDNFEEAVQHLVATGRSDQPQILVVDDDENYSRLVAAVLRQAGMIVSVINNPLVVLDKLDQLQPDLILLDVMMPGLNGLDVCRMLRTLPRWRHTPILFLTSDSGLQIRLSTIKCGGDDYLHKPFNEEELVARVKMRIERARILKDKSERDPVTGLWLRRAFSERFSTMIADATRRGTPIALALFDVDHFKSINDGSGHLSGDNVLAGLGRLLQQRFRSNDLRGRWGGDEFILALDNTSADEAASLLKRFQKDLSETSFVAEDEQELHVTLSVGVASYRADGDSIYDLVRVADKRLYAAKAQGRNLVCWQD